VGWSTCAPDLALAPPRIAKHAPPLQVPCELALKVVRLHRPDSTILNGKYDVTHHLELVEITRVCMTSRAPSPSAWIIVPRSELG